MSTSRYTVSRVLVLAASAIIPAAGAINLHCAADSSLCDDTPLLTEFDMSPSTPLEAVMIAGLAAGMSCLAMILINAALWLHFRPTSRRISEEEKSKLDLADDTTLIEPFPAANSLGLFEEPKPIRGARSAYSDEERAYRPVLQTPQLSTTPSEWRYATYPPSRGYPTVGNGSQAQPMSRTISPVHPRAPRRPTVPLPLAAYPVYSPPALSRPIERLRTCESSSGLSSPFCRPQADFRPVLRAVPSYTQSSPPSPVKGSFRSGASLRRVSSARSFSPLNPRRALENAQLSSPSNASVWLPQNRAEDDLYDPTLLYSPMTTFRRHTDAGSMIMDEPEDIVDLPPLYTDVPRKERQ